MADDKQMTPEMVRAARRLALINARGFFSRLERQMSQTYAELSQMFATERDKELEIELSYLALQIDVIAKAARAAREPATPEYVKAYHEVEEEERRHPERFN